jgi:site-specific recombinase XerD
VDWANEFLDVQRLRGLSLCSLRAYAYDLLNLARWFETASIELSSLTQAKLIDYIRFQSDHEPQPAAQTVNHRITVTRSLYRFHHGREIPSQHHGRGTTFAVSHPFGYSPRHSIVHKLRVRVPGRVVVPLTATEVSQFWSSFRTFRDLSIIALMLFNGLRSREVITLQLEDLHFAQSQVCVQGKGNRRRILPLDPQTIKVIESYLRVERPLTNSPFVFVVLKGANRGNPLTLAGIRSLFRHHRHLSKVAKANPHRFRHTFGADMIRAGISLPALMRLMGHSHIKTTMFYAQLCPRDVFNEFYRAVQRLERPKLPEDL